MFCGGSSVPREVEVEVQRECLTLRFRSDEGGTAGRCEKMSIPWELCAFSSGGANSSMAVVEWEDGFSLYVYDGRAFYRTALAVVEDAAVRERLEKAADLHRRVTFRVNLHLWSGLALLVAVLLAAVYYLHTLEERVVSWVPVEFEKKWSSTLVADLSNAAVKVPPEMEMVLDRLVEHSPASFRSRYGDSVRLFLVGASEVNAFALPAGKILVYTGLVAETSSDDEFAGVLAHELQHSAHRDPLLAMVSALKWKLVVSTLFGDLDGMEGLLASNASLLLKLKYSRDLERRADAEGMKLMVRAGFDPCAMIDFYRRMAKRSGILAVALFSDHPAMGERIAALEELCAELSKSGAVKPRELVPDAAWAAMKAHLASR